MDKQTHIIFIMSLFIFILFIGKDWMKDTLISIDANSLDGIDIYADIMKSAPKKIIEGLAPNSLNGRPNQSAPPQSTMNNNIETDILTTWRTTQTFNYNTSLLNEPNSFEQTTNNMKYMNKIKGY
jgi:hypothetical protein